MNCVKTYACCVLIGKRLTTVNYPGNKRWMKRWVGPTIKALVSRQERAGPQPIPRRRSFLEWNEEAELYAFNSRLSEKFDPELLARAFTFRSYLAEEERKQQNVGIESAILETKDNTDLIEQGQRISEDIINAYLCKALPRAPQECIHALLDHLMSQEVVAKVSSHIGTKDLILTADHPVMEDTLACTFFALVGALEQSPDVDSVHVAKFVRDFLIACLHDKDIPALWRPDDPEAILNDILAREDREEAEPRLIGQAGVRSLLAVYRVAFYSNKEFLGSGFGETVEEAREAAAIESLNRMFGLADSCKPIPYDLAIDTTSELNTKNLPLSQWCSKNVNKLMSQ